MSTNGVVGAPWQLYPQPVELLTVAASNARDRISQLLISHGSQIRHTIQLRSERGGEQPSLAS
jgi:hypothetical protein